MTPFVFDRGALSPFFIEDRRRGRVVEAIHGERALRLLPSVTLSGYLRETCQTLGRDVASPRAQQPEERMRVVEAGQSPKERQVSRSTATPGCRQRSHPPFRRQGGSPGPF